MDNSNRKKLFIVRREPGGIGGAEKVAHRFVESFAKHYETELVHSGRVIDGFKIKGTKGPSWLKCLRFADSAREFIAKNPKALVLSMERGVPGTIYRAGDGVHANWQKYKYANKFKRILNPMNYLLPKLEKISVEKSNYVIANSKLVKRHIEKLYLSFPRDRISVVYNGCDDRTFRRLPCAEKNKVRKKWNYSEEDLNLLFSGSGWERKGLAWVFELTKLLSAKGLNVKVWVAGRGDKDRFWKLAKRLKIRECVQFLGSVKNVEELYQISDCMIMPTKYDAFSNSCLEALACGCPIVTSTQNGASSLIDGTNGMIIDLGNSHAINEARDYVIRIKENGKEINWDNFSDSFKNEREIQQYCKFLESP